MGARQSKRSVDITTTPKKGDIETASVKEDKIEKLGDADVEVLTNGTVAHTDIEFADKDETKEAKENVPTEVKENGLPDSSDGEKTPDKEAAAPAAGDQPTNAETTEKIAENGEKTAETPDSKKPKDKKKKKWSLRSISFSKKDKSKPGKEKEKNGEVEEVNEEKEEETPKTPEEVKTDEAKEAEEVKPESTDKVAIPEEVVVKTPEVEAPATEAKVVEPVAPSNEQVAVEAPKEEEKPKPVALEETKPEKVEETTTVQSEEVKEVAVFAESLKDNAISSIETTSPPVVESQCPSEIEPVSVEAPVVPVVTTESVIETTESAAKVESSPIETQIPVKESSSVETEKAVKESSPEESEILVKESFPVETEIPVKEASAVETEMPVKESPQVSESQPEMKPINPPVEETKLESPEVLPEIPTVVASAEEIKVAENEAKNDPVVIEAQSEVTENQPSTKEPSETDIPSAGDTSPFVIEKLSKSTEQAVEDVPSNTTVLTEESTLSIKESETSNLPETDSKLEFKIEDQESSESLSSVPVVIEEKLPVVSSAGDVPNPLDSQTSFEYNDHGDLQELKSNLNLKDSNTSQESNPYSEDPSLDLSTIPEAVESNESKLGGESKSIPDLSSTNVESNETTNSIVEPQQDDKGSPKVETLCNADSLADLSTESLPSLPEPTDSVLEPMSLPPLDFLPDPLVDDNLPIESPVKLNETEPEVVLTNGNATNGLISSPAADDDVTPPLPPPDGPLKQQVVTPEPVGACEISQTTEEKADTETTQSEAQ